MRKLSRVVSIAFGLATFAAGVQAWGQAVYTPRYNWSYYRAPVSYAGDVMRAYGEMNVDLAVARERHAIARRLEIANSIEEVKAVWERRTIGEIERYKRMTHLLDSQKKQNSKTWDRIQNHPELTGPAIINGSALNFLLNRLNSTLLAYDFAGGTSGNPELIRELPLSPSTIHSLKLRQRSTNNQSFIFRADEGTALNVDWWPYALGAPEFHSQRRTFEQARERVISESKNGKISYDAIKALSKSLNDLQIAFLEKYSGSAKTDNAHGSRMETWNHYNTGKRFLTSLEGEVRRLAQTQKSTAFDGSLKFDGDNVLALLTFMSRNGLDFAPSEPGEEAAYHELFKSMRDLYGTVAEADDAIKPPERNRTVGEK